MIVRTFCENGPRWKRSLTSLRKLMGFWSFRVEQKFIRSHSINNRSKIWRRPLSSEDYNFHFTLRSFFCSISMDPTCSYFPYSFKQILLLIKLLRSAQNACWWLSMIIETFYTIYSNPQKNRQNSTTFRKIDSYNLQMPWLNT